MAVETLLQGFRQAAPDEPLTALLVRLIERANHQINESASALGTQGMATTVVACALRHDRAAIAHVGDSRCYLLQGRRASVLTQDHTVAAERARIAGHRDAADLQHRHVLSRALGSELAVNADSCEHTLHAGDVLVLCSDGLYASMPADQLASIVSSAATPQDAARELVATANRQDGTDNASVQLIRVKSVEQVGMYRGRPYKLK
jgi:protein phosphatase